MLRVEFTIDSQATNTWQTVVDAIEDGLGGALLQDAFDPFGEQAGDALQALLDESEDSYWHLVAGQVDDTDAWLEFEAAIFTPCFIEQLSDWIKLCGAQKLQCSEDDECG